MITYDEAKRIANLKKHGLDFVGCETIFDEFMLVFKDDREAYGEERYLALGLKSGRVVAVVYTERNDNIRIISLRKATSNEHKRYFEARGD
ncbi:BrnT family toxin [Chromatium okenii]|uniref:BrnT family toxin n=1 Tax=Chromatium okenii TaxID=61644 RepID=A0A2S7XSI9_9GAMM|nr:BrnT family toxin [Chromatium okenii]PQJ96428.1 hypothetical protein CXB77_11030 [Chromatium okenii]